MAYRMPYTRLLCVCVLLLGGCKATLYSSVGEQEANEMVSLLRMNDIYAWKRAAREGTYAVQVEEVRFAEAVALLRAEGYPRPHRVSLADLFQGSGPIPTPFEERVRYLYGISEELSRTLSLFDGVVATRVHVVLPEGEGEERTRGKVSIYIKYDQRFNLGSLVPKIKKLASDSVSRVGYEDVELLALPAYVQKFENPAPRSYELFAGIGIYPSHYREFLFVVSGVGILFGALLGLLGWVFFLYRRAVRGAV